MTRTAAMTLGSEFRVLASLAWPVVVGQLGWMMLNVVDVILVGRIGSDALGAIALGQTWSIGVTIVALGAAHGLDPAFAQAFGAGERQVAGLALARGTLLLLLLSVPIGWMHAMAGPALRLLGEPPELIPEAAAYCQTLAWSAPAMLMFAPLRQFLQGAGQMRPGTVAIIAGNIVNFALAWMLIGGNFGFPAWGLHGAAIATLISRYAMVAVLAVLGWPLVRTTWPRSARTILDLQALLHLTRLGGPVGLQAGLEVWAFSAVTLWMGAFGPVAVSAHIVALNLASISFMVPYGVSAAAATRVGNLLGAGQPWQRAGWVAVATGAGVMCFSASLFLVFPVALAGFYTHDAQTIKLAASFLPMAAMFQLFDGTQTVAFGVLRGAGDTRVPLLANVVGYWLIGLPLGAALAFAGGAGPRGLWVGLILGLMTVACLLLLRLRYTAARGGYLVLADAPTPTRTA